MRAMQVTRHSPQVFDTSPGRINGFIFFENASTADHATITMVNQFAELSFAPNFFGGGTATAGDATIINNGGTTNFFDREQRRKRNDHNNSGGDAAFQ